MSHRASIALALFLALATGWSTAQAQETAAAPAAAPQAQPAAPAPAPAPVPAAAPAPAPAPAADTAPAADPATLPPAAEPGFHEHDGFFFRLLVGGGGSWIWSKKDAGGFHASGWTTVDDLGLGYSVVKNLSLSLEVFGGLQWNSNHRVTNKQDSSVVFPVKNVFMMGFGPGITYYFMPLNLYIAMALGGSYMKINYLDVSSDTNVSTMYKDFDPAVGFGMHEAIGKEWWVGGDWGVGVGGEFYYLLLPDVHSWWHDIGFGISFSVTYN